MKMGILELPKPKKDEGKYEDKFKGKSGYPAVGTEVVPDSLPLLLGVDKSAHLNQKVLFQLKFRFFVVEK